MKKSYVEYIIEETQKILAIDSPSGYTQNVADYLMKEYRKLGYDCLNTVTIRKDFQAERFETLSTELILDMDFRIKRYKE